MLKSITGAVLAIAAFGGVAMQTGAAGAMPIDTAPATMAQTAAAGSVDQVHWVCGPYRCFWRPGFYRPYPVYGYGYRRWHRPYWGGGWRRGWHDGGWHHGWHRGWHRW